MYPKWEAYQQLCQRIPERHIPIHIKCQELGEMMEAWHKVKDDDGLVSLRTDAIGGGIGLPFVPRANRNRLLNFFFDHDDDDLIFLVLENIRAEINGKVVIIDDEHVLIEWARCDTARDFDIGKAKCEKSIVLGPNSKTVWGETILPVLSPEYGYGVQADRIYHLMFLSGLKESCWSLTDKEKRLVLWG